MTASLGSRESRPLGRFATDRSAAGAVITGLILYRNDSSRNLHRYYRLDVQPDLFGAWCFVREWGRIGKAAQTRAVPFPTPAAAQAALDKQCRVKEPKGDA